MKRTDQQDISVILPVYNGDSTLEACVQSVMAAGERVAEIIIVDDGSVDETAAIAGRLSERDKRIRLIRTENHGSYTARLTGIRAAAFPYIAFIDADDLVSDKYIETILNKAKTDEFDYCYFGWRTKDSIYMIEEEPPEWNHSVWNCLYKRSLIGDNRFNENYYMNEDGLFNENVRKGKRDNILEILYFYNWNVRDDNISSLYRDNKIPLNKE